MAQRNHCTPRGADQAGIGAHGRFRECDDANDAEADDHRERLHRVVFDARLGTFAVTDRSSSGTWRQLTPPEMPTVVGGRADVYLDDKLAVSGLSLRHYRTQPHAVVFSREGLPDGPHPIRIVSTSGDESSLSPDAFQILGGNTKGRVRLGDSDEPSA